MSETNSPDPPRPRRRSRPTSPASVRRSPTPSTSSRPRLDVKARTPEAKVAELRDRATDDDGRPTPAVIGAAVGALLLIGALVYRRRSH